MRFAQCVLLYEFDELLLPFFLDARLLRSGIA